MKKIFLAVLVFLLTAGCSIQSEAQVKEVDAIGITVSDLNRSVDFYTQVLGFQKVSEYEGWGEESEQLAGQFGIHFKTARLQLGTEFIELTDYLTSGGRSIPEDAKSNDLFFQHIAIVVSDMDRAYTRLRSFGVEHVSTAPQTLPVSIPAAAGIRAFYFHDPDRHNLELIYFPKGKGQDRWQQAKGRLFLGIDHTAIGIRNTDSSLRFYQAFLGIERKGDSWNQGIEQAHLNFVENASLHITGLRSSQGPGIEFLQYINPGPGRTYPADSRVDDIWHWQTILVADHPENLFGQLRNQGYHLVSTRLSRIHTSGNRSALAFLVRDPDGHALLIRESFK